MKLSFQSIIQLLTLSFLTFVITLAHATAPKMDTIYTVQLGTFQDMSIADFEDIRHAGYLYAENLAQGGQMSVFVSNYKDKKRAEDVLYLVKSKGYDDAFVSERPLAKGENVYVVQLASQDCRDFIDWDKYARGGQMYVITNGTNIKITSMPFRDLEKAKEKAAILNKLGFNGAFVKNANTLALHKVTQFNTVRDINFMPAAVSIDKDSNTEGVTEVDEEAVVTIESPTTSIPDFAPKAPTSVDKTSRTSVKSLQKFLKNQNSYSSSLDGIYGKGTASGIAMLESSNRQLNRYKIISSERSKSIEEEPLTTLESIIVTLHNDPKSSYAELAKQKSPMAKAYRAYILFIADQPNNQDKINDLMNEAINEAYAGFAGEAPFDYSSTYAYTDLEQLILHTRYVQAALNEEPITPCWLFIKHKDEAYSAFRKATEKGIDGYKMQNCEGFLQWDNVILLKTISTDLNPDEDHFTDEMLKKERAYASRRNRLYLIPRALNQDEEKNIVAWNDQLWKSMDLRIGEDKFFAKFAVPFKLAYHKAWIQLEDYYIEKGFKKYQANALALSVLQSVVGVDVQTYMQQ